MKAWLAGMVHGWWSDHYRGRLGHDGKPNAAASVGLRQRSNATSVDDARTHPASANAEPQSKHQFTGLRLLNMKPPLTISASADFTGLVLEIHGLVRAGEVAPARRGG